MVDISTLILKALHRLTLFLFGLYYTFKIWWNRSKDRMSLQQLLDVTKQGHFKRIPKHLAFIANLEDYEYICDYDLVKLICWAMLIQIPYLSIHDPDGFLKRRQKAILSRVREYLISQEIEESDFQLKADVDSNEFISTIKDHTTHVKFLSVVDGRPQLTEVIKELVSAKLSNYNNNEPTELKETHPIEITEALRKRWNYPEPDFAIVCSSTYSVHGYPPWQLRYTEVSKLNHPSDVTVEAFYNQICIFNKIEQRFGA